MMQKQFGDGVVVNEIEEYLWTAPVHDVDVPGYWKQIPDATAYGARLPRNSGNSGPKRKEKL